MFVPDYLVIGHVTKDLVPDGTFRVGGTATYSALTAHRLGLRTGVLTSADPTQPLFEGVPLTVCRRPARCTTTFENIIVRGARRQIIRAIAERLTVTDLPLGWDGAPIVHLGPVAQEVDVDLVGAFPRSFLGITPQGWLRRWDDQGVVFPVEWDRAECVLEMADAVVLSLEDVGGDWQRLGRYARRARTLVMTIGREGAVVYHKGQVQRVPAYAVSEVDATGAGDVFASAFFAHLFETQDVLDATRFANCVASFVVEGLGAAHVPTKEQVMRRLRHGRLAD